MSRMILGLLAETFVHPGSGQNEGAIDLPVAREAATGFPYVAGSSFKGALKEYARATWKDVGQGDDAEPSADVTRVFGQQESAGDLLPSDVRLLLLPVRSLHASYKWVTCPLLLERFERDCQRMGTTVRFNNLPEGLGDDAALCAEPGAVTLEELSFKTDALPGGLTAPLAKLIRHERTRQRLDAQIVVVSDKRFVWFARFALSVQARNVLNEHKTSQDLWYEETLPPDTLMYALLDERRPGAVSDVKGLFTSRPYLQIGGNETVGQGCFALQWTQGGGYA